MRSTILVVLDSLRRDHLGAYNPDVTWTDHLDRIAGASIVYEDVTAQAPWTLPSHASVFTGRYPWDHGATNAKAHLDAERRTLAQLFADRGYTTAAITPNIWVTPHKGMTDGFDRVENFLGAGGRSSFRNMYRAASSYVEHLPERLRRPFVEPVARMLPRLGIDTECRSEETIDAAIRFLEAHTDEDVFLFVNLMEPHEPYRPPQPYRDRHDVQDLDLVPDDTAAFFDREVDFEAVRTAYRASVDYTDDLIGRLERAIGRLGLEDAVLVVAADHGQALGEGGYYGHQFTVRDEVVSVPLIVRHPTETPRRIDQAVELRSLYRLLPRFAGFAPAADVVPGDGVARGGYEFPKVFKRYIADEAMDYYYRKYRYLRTEEETLVKSQHADGTSSYERIDRSSGRHRPIRSRDRRRLDELGDVDGERPPGTFDHPPEVEDRLSALGYR